MEHLFDYLLFLAQAVTVVLAILVVAGMVATMNQRRQEHEPGHLEVRKLNQRLTDLRHAVEEIVLPEGELKHRRKQEMREEKQTAKAERRETADEGSGKPRLFVLDFDGDLEATRTEQLRTEISAILSLARPTDAVLLRLTSPGGMVPHYGLAASQLHRIRKQDIPLVVAVDKVAASGGYLMAAVASRIIAAPFALVGSIGVVAEVPNVHRLLEKNNVDWDVYTAGQHKRTLTVFGRNTEEGRQKFIEELEDTHALFKEFVSENRPDLDMDAIATGEAWYGRRAIDLRLVDELCTSDEYVTRACEDRDVFEVRWVEHRRPIDRLMSELRGMTDRLGRLLAWVR
ncbi:MAG: protease SohB [Thermomicrobiales bacterium]|nr:protease SohB [Thermomicrobiales bacterium]MCP5180303.1 protease SohB [Pseudomonadales bacterium]